MTDLIRICKKRSKSDQNLQEEDRSCQNLQDEKRKLSWINLIRLTILTRDQTDWADECSVLSVEVDVAI